MGFGRPGLEAQSRQAGHGGGGHLRRGEDDGSAPAQLPVQVRVRVPRPEGRRAWQRGPLRPPEDPFGPTKIASTLSAPVISSRRRCTLAASTLASPATATSAATRTTNTQRPARCPAVDTRRRRARTPGRPSRNRRRQPPPRPRSRTITHRPRTWDRSLPVQPGAQSRVRPGHASTQLRRQSRRTARRPPAAWDWGRCR